VSYVDFEGSATVVVADEDEDEVEEDEEGPEETEFTFHTFSPPSTSGHTNFEIFGFGLLPLVQPVLLYLPLIL
jgi:hypothetical protein